MKCAQLLQAYLRSACDVGEEKLIFDKIAAFATLTFQT